METTRINTSSNGILFPAIIREERIEKDFSLGTLELEINITDKYLIEENEIIAFIKGIGKGLYTISCSIEERLYNDLQISRATDKLSSLITRALENGQFTRFGTSSDYVLYTIME